MRTLAVAKRIEATPDEVWAVLADFPNIASWNDGIKASEATSEATGGVGATRHCDVAPAGGLEETVREWQPASKMVVTIDSATKIPLKNAEVTFLLEQAGNHTDTSINYEFAAKGGPLSAVLEPLMSRPIKKGLGEFLDQLETAAQNQASV